MLGRIDRQKRGTARGSPRRSRTAKAAHISRRAMKLCCAREWGGWGRLSVDGSGQHNPSRSEDPWSRATYVTRMAVLPPSRWSPAQNGRRMLPRRARRMETNLFDTTGTLGASLTGARSGKVLSDRPALEPQRGKPALRNLRGDRGNVGIIRSPVRASILPDHSRSVGRSQLATGTGPAAREGPSYCHCYACFPNSGDHRNQQFSRLASVFPRTSSVRVYRGTQPDRGAIFRRATDGGVGT
jgi:hypothetical protein